jgi:hypothetical protein
MPCGQPLCPQAVAGAWGGAQGGVGAEAGGAGAVGGAGVGAAAGAGAAAGGVRLPLMQMTVRMMVGVWMLMRGTRVRQQQQEGTGRQQQSLGAWGTGSTLLEVCLSTCQVSSGSSEAHAVLLRAVRQATSDCHK